MLLCSKCSSVKSSDTGYSSRQVRKYKASKKQSSSPVDLTCLACTDASNQCNTTLTLVPWSGMHVTVVPLGLSGLSYHPDFLTPAEADLCMRIVDGNRWVEEIKRRQQFYGDVYYHTTRAGGYEKLQPRGGEGEGGLREDIGQFDWLKSKMTSPPWRSLIFGSLPFPTQILVNEYVGVQGIASHFEDPSSFGPIIATISLLMPTLMRMSKPLVPDNDCEDLVTGGLTKVLLEPGSLLVMKGEAREGWRHGISRTAVNVPVRGGGTIRRDDGYRRVSLTIRHLLEGRRGVKDG
ncbi:hypothetical protein TrCOL_g7407 [Triparma columacea]|uniref:Alpha-ketoglutarate-dependent dioxygenase AlkB-like domain-containing protein n=1 Tax=Triparma columacea TaxID=722753 RepID=A0A9W7FV57_9STRA|nr:hypothetical protein TrCOL_g7407 [Triparma columacea]